MNGRMLKINWPLAALTLTFLAFVGYQSHAIRTLQDQLHPAIIAVVDLERIFNELQERQNADEQLQAIAADLQNQAEAKAQSIRELEEEIELYTAGTEKYQATMEKLSMATLDYQAFAEFSQRKLDVEKGLTLKRLYVLIKSAAHEEARSRGIDLILVNDSLGEIPAMGEAETTRQISARRMLFTGSTIDVTDDLLQRLNARLGAASND